MSFHATLPRKRASSGLLICDDTGAVLLVKPNYKSYWDLPGGHVEAGESPRAAAQREAKEELGVDVTVAQLLVVDYFPQRGTVTEALMFVFAGEIARDLVINLDPSELEAHRWCHEKEAMALTVDAPILARRLEQAWDAFWSDKTFYLESGRRTEW